MAILTEILSPHPSDLWKLVKQAGVDGIVGLLDGGEQEARWLKEGPRNQVVNRWESGQEPWSEFGLRKLQRVYATGGFFILGIEDTAPMDKTRLGLPGRDEEIERVMVQIRAMGLLGIPVLCYNWMSLTSWARTDFAVPIRGGALSTRFSQTQSEQLPPLVAKGEIIEEQLWAAHDYFLEAVLPVAEESGVRLALHPDDPPIPNLRGVPRIMSTLDAFRRVLDSHSSPANAIALCQGNFALMTDDLPSFILEMGTRNAVAFVHFRDIIGKSDDFVESFHDNGQTDMPACMRAYAEIGFEGPMRPDHVPTMYGESNDRPGYASLGRLFALGYIRGLEQAAYGKNLK